MDEIKSIINTVLKNNGKNIAETIDQDSLLREDLGFDSFELAELTVRIEAQFDVDIFEDGLITKVGEILEKVNQG